MAYVPVRKKLNTSVYTDTNGYTCVRLYNTMIVKFSKEKGECSLDAGNFFTVTTKNRMNQVSKEYDLGFRVYQENFDWFVYLYGHNRYKDLPFENGMVIKI